MPYRAQLFQQSNSQFGQVNFFEKLLHGSQKKGRAGSQKKNRNLPGRLNYKGLPVQKNSVIGLGRPVIRRCGGIAVAGSLSRGLGFSLFTGAKQGAPAFLQDFKFEHFLENSFQHNGNWFDFFL
jgi:hypothetical protein